MKVVWDCPSPEYISNVMKWDAFLTIHDLFKRAHSPAKEMTESYAAYKHLKKFLREGDRVIHIGDGAHSRTAAMFALRTKTINYSIDPIANLKVIQEWIDKWSIERVYPLCEKIEDIEVAPHNQRTHITFVHAHVNTDEVLAKIPNWYAAYINSCCFKNKQISKKYKIHKEGKDWGIFSPQNDYQVILNVKRLV